jgi:hypothetical protein
VQVARHPNRPGLEDVIARLFTNFVEIHGDRRFADDPAAGFDGYQSVDTDQDDPSAGVDAQVRAIWTAVVNEYRLQYINPPPAYSRETQRLRTPTDIVTSNTGHRPAERPCLRWILAVRGGARGICHRQGHSAGNSPGRKP